jgi:hypothetical protein
MDYDRFNLPEMYGLVIVIPDSIWGGGVQGAIFGLHSGYTDRDFS